MKIVNFNTVEKTNIEEGSILEFLASDYQKDTMQYVNIFKLIGKPVDKASTPVVFPK